jgi:hypothetical protein
MSEGIVRHHCAGLSGLDSVCLTKPRAYARGYVLPALRAWFTCPPDRRPGREAGKKNGQNQRAMIVPAFQASILFVSRNHALTRVANVLPALRAWFTCPPDRRPGREAGKKNGQNQRAPKVRPLPSSNSMKFPERIQNPELRLRETAPGKSKSSR